MSFNALFVGTRCLLLSFSAIVIAPSLVCQAQAASTLSVPQAGGPVETVVALRGTILTSDGLPLRQGEVSITSLMGSSAPRTTTTDANGTFQFPGVFAGAATLRVQSKGVTLLEQAVQVEAGKPLDLQLNGARIQVQQTAVVTTTLEKLQTDITSDPAGMPTLSTTVTAEQIEHTTTGRYFQEVLNRVPGVVIATLQQGDIGFGVKVRGFFRASHGAEVATYVDGMPQNLVASSIGQGLNDMNWLNPMLVDKIELIKGPFSALYGGQNRAASINIVTKDAAQSEFTTTAGRFGFVDSSFIFSRKTGPLQTLVAAQLQRAGDSYRVNSDYIRGNIFAKESFRAAGGVWGVRGVYSASNWNAPGFLLVSQIISGTVKPTDRDLTSPALFGDANRSNIVITRRPEQGETGLLFTAFAERYNRRRATGVNSTVLNIASDSRWTSGGRALWTQNLRDRAQFTYGGEVRNDYGPGEVRQFTSGAYINTYGQRQNLNMTGIAGFFQGQVKLLPSFKVSGGLRVDGYHYDIDNLKLPASSVVYNSTVATPKIGFAWSPLEKLSAFFNMGQGVRTVEQAEISPVGSAGPLGAAGGAPITNVAPPKITSYDYGFKTQLGNRVTVTAAGFYIANQSEVQQISAYVYQANGDATRIGWEAEGRVQASNSLALYASLTDIVTSRLNNPPNGISSLLNVPQYVPKAGLAYAHLVRGGAVALNLDSFYYSGFPYYAGTPLRLLRTKPYSRFDLRGSYDVRRVQLTGFVQLQPYRNSSESMYSTAAGLFIDPPAKWNGGFTGRVRF